MDEESRINYYAILPATIRYSKELSSSEKLLYAEITALTNKKGYCYAKNKYFAELYNVTNHTVSQWVSHLEKLKYLKIELIRDSKNEIKERRIYIIDTPYVQKYTYPYVEKNTYPMYKNIQENNININNLFNLIINKSDAIDNEFYLVLQNLEFIYPKEILKQMREENINKLKEITYVLYNIYNSSYKIIMPKFKREVLIEIYLLCKQDNSKEFLNYYRESIIQRYLLERK